MQVQKRSRVFVWIMLVLFMSLGAIYGLARAGYLIVPAFTAKRPAPMPTPAATRDGRWQQAIEYLGSQLPALHVNPYFKISEAEFQKSVTELAVDVPQLNDEQITVEMMRIAASIGDGHTGIFPFADSTRFPRLPMEMRWLEDGLIVIAASPEYEQAVGAKVVRIGDHPIEQVYEAIKPLISADNEMQIMNYTPIYAGIPGVLYGLGVIPQKDRVTFGFEAQDGSQFSLELLPSSDAMGQLISVYEKAGYPVPLYEQDRNSFYWARDLPESNAVYVQYNVCGQQKDKPFNSFVDEVFDLVDRGQETRLVLDLRFNGGGNEAVLSPFLEEIEKRPAYGEPGNLYVIIGRGTYSSALQNAITLNREYNAILVGEPTAGKPNHYGEVRNFELPNVGLRAWYSTRYWLNYPTGDPLSLEPDVSAVLTMADLLAGRDPALEAALQP
jgi:hypothetical protein